jgi:hypothetical protein
MNRVPPIATKLFALALLLLLATPAQCQTTLDVCELVVDSDLRELGLFNVVRLKSFNIIPASETGLGVPIVNQSCEYLGDSEASDTSVNRIRVFVRNLPPDVAIRIKGEYRESFFSGSHFPKVDGISTFSDEAAECFIVPKLMSSCEGIAGRASLIILMSETIGTKAPMTQDQALKYFHLLASRLELKDLADLPPEKLSSWNPSGRQRFERMPDANVRREK